MRHMGFVALAMFAFALRAEAQKVKEQFTDGKIAPTT